MSFPSDIDPELGCRLPLPKREDLDPEAQASYDRIVKGGAGAIRGLKGPSGIQLHSSKYSKHARPVNYYLRYEAGFTPRVREIAILTTARECDSQFEWAAHEPEALKEGIAPALIDVIRSRAPLTGVDPADAAIIALGREMFGARKVELRNLRRGAEAIRPARAGRSRRADGELRRHGRDPHGVRYAARPRHQAGTSVFALGAPR